MSKERNSSKDQLTFFFDEREESKAPLEGRIVCVVGSFRQSIYTLQHFFQELGADFRPTAKPNRNVHYVLLGEGATAQTLEYLQTMAFHGFCPRVLRSQDIDDLLHGADIEKYIVPKNISKNLKLTYRHYELMRLDLTEQMNPLYTHELFVPSDTSIASEELYQLLGNKGVYANTYIDDTTDTLLLSDASLLRLREEGTDATIQYIESTYNNSKAQYFRYAILSESDVVEAFSS